MRLKLKMINTYLKNACKYHYSREITLLSLPCLNFDSKIIASLSLILTKIPHFLAKSFCAKMIKGLISLVLTPICSGMVSNYMVLQVLAESYLANTLVMPCICSLLYLTVHVCFIFLFMSIFVLVLIHVIKLHLDHTVQWIHGWWMMDKQIIKQSGKILA